MAQVSSDLFVQGLYREIEWCCGRVTNFLLRICLLRPFYHFRQRRLKLSWRAVLSDDLVYDLGYTKWSEGGLGSFSLTGVGWYCTTLTPCRYSRVLFWGASISVAGGGSLLLVLLALPRVIRMFSMGSALALSACSLPGKGHRHFTSVECLSDWLVRCDGVYQ